MYISAIPTGFQVRISRLGIEAYFPSSKVGKEEALRQAREFRDKTIAETKAGHRDGYQYHRRFHHKDLDEAMAGVCLSVRRRRCGHIEACFKAVIGVSEKHLSLRKTFSIRTYGYVGAYQMALKTRVDAIGMLIDIESIPLKRPTPSQYALLISLSRDVPYPL